MQSELIQHFANKDNKLTVKDYMEFCLYSETGFYNRFPFGKDGSFITAPMISSIFADCISIFLLNLISEKFQNARKINIIEIGLGNGKLLYDIQNCIEKIKDNLEISYYGLDRSFGNLEYDIQNFNRLSSLSDVKSLTDPVFIISNELFDAYPVNQYVLKNDKWQQVLISIQSDKLHKGLTDNFDHTELENHIDFYYKNQNIPVPKILEISDEIYRDFNEICAIINRNSGCFLTFDYGGENLTTSTIQTINKHKQVDLLEFPMESDITTLVNFANLARIVGNFDELNSILMTQGEFLRSNGIAYLADNYKKNSPEMLEVIDKSVNRLANSDEMGELFKAFCVIKI